MAQILKMDAAFDQSDRVGPQLVRILRAQIIRGMLVPGTRMSESEIASLFSVSRQPVREAFIKLAEEGLLEVRPQRGSFVPKISIKAVNDARFVREAIEADIIKLLAAEPDANLIKELRGQISEQKKAIGEPSAFIALDDMFHQTLAEAADKAHAWKLVEGLKSQLDRVRHLAIQHFPMAALVKQHSAIVAAVESGDLDAAEGAVRTHLNAIAAELPLIAAENPDHFRDPDTERNFSRKSS